MLLTPDFVFSNWLLRSIPIIQNNLSFFIIVRESMGFPCLSRFHIAECRSQNVDGT